MDDPVCDEAGRLSSGRPCVKERAGVDGKEDCDNCCFICNGGRTPALVLE